MKRKTAQRIRRLREMSPEKLEQKGFGLLKSDENFRFEIVYFIDELLHQNLTVEQQLQLLGVMIKMHKAFFG